MGLFTNNVFTFKNLPVEEKQRKWTDCCCTIFTAVFALSLFILSFIMFTRYNYYKVNFPANDNGVTCYNDQKDAPYMFFQNLNRLQSGRHCLKSCPAKGQSLSCSGNFTLSCSAILSQYDTQPVVNRIGAFCAPTDQSASQKLFSQQQLGTKLTLVYGYDVVLFTLLIAFLIGIIYLVLVSCLPKIMTYAVFILASLVLLASALYIIIKPVSLFGSNNNLWSILLVVGLFAMFLVYLFYLGCYKNQIQLASIFMKHGDIFLKETPLVYLYIPLFIILTLGLLVLIVWQYIAFGTQYQPNFDKNKVYYSSNHNVPLQICNFIQLVWGIQFLRDAFNFLVSGNAVQWYFKPAVNASHCCKPFSRLMCKHWGSVAGGSFLNAFFKIFDIFSDCFRCNAKGPCGKCFSCYQTCCCCNYIFQLVRTDAYSYINLTGIPFCNAARQCQALCRYSELVKNSQSCLRIYRQASHIFIIGLIALISYTIFDARTALYGGYDHFRILVAIILAAYCTSTYFLDIHPNSAQGIMTCFLAEANCQGNQLQVCPGQLRQDIYNYQRADSFIQ